MTTRLNLSDSDRHFLADVSLLAFGNPYGETGREVRLALADGQPDTQLCDRVHARLHTRLQELRSDGADRIAAYAEPDRPLLHHAILFDLLYRARSAFDALIREQIERGAHPCRAPFVLELVRHLTRAGMTASVALHYLAIYFQMRRARYYLEQTLTGDSPGMERLRHDLWNSIFTHDFELYERHLWDQVRELSTLFVGEPGSGKRTAAAAVSFSSYIPYREKTEAFAESFVDCFIPVRVAQYSGLRLESELFGHQQGAYAEALENYHGVFSRCSPYGTIFLDDICEVPSAVQARLLGVGQDRTFTPIGDQIRHDFPGRLMAAAPGRLAAIRQEKSIRDDLYHHLAVNTIAVPALKQCLQEKPSDLERLIEHILGRYTEQSAAKLVGMVIERMHEHVGSGYDWPGNIRELEQIVKRILMVSHYESRG